MHYVHAMTRFTAFAMPIALAGCVGMSDNAPTSDGWADFSTATRAGPVTVQPLQVVEDSRCPSDARCVWEGRLVIEAKLTIDGQETRANLIAFQPKDIAGGSLTTDAVEPRSVLTGAPPSRQQYRFHFTFEDEG